MRILLAIGCNQYDLPSLAPLKGAVNDARAMFEHLVTDGWGDYDQEASRLLVSPTLAEAQAVLARILFDNGPLNEFTIFFAGHGGTKDDSYFMCLRDTHIDRLSVTSLSMVQLFAWLSEAKVRQTNIVIDACQSGGVTRDIGTLLNPNNIGKSGSPSVSILAASAADEGALEVGGRGVCTGALLQCLKGKVVVQTNRPALDLVEVGRAVSELLEGQPQSPVSWGLNLYGRAQFAKNPRFVGGAPHVSEVLTSFSANASATRYLQDKSDDIWELYVSLGRGFDADKFLHQMRPICEHFDSDAKTLAAFVDGIAETFGARLRRTDDPFDEPRLYAACVSLLLSQASTEPVAALAHDLALKFCESLNGACSNLLKRLEAEEYALLGSGQSDLYFLPLRLLSVLGWIGAGALVASWLNRDEFLVASDGRRVVGLIVEKYAGSLVSVSDEQAAYLLAFFAARGLLNAEGEAELVVSLLYSDYCRSKGMIARSGATGSEVFDFISARANGDYSKCDGVLARPSSLLPALLLAYDALGIQEVANGCMRDLDHSAINIFVPTTHADFLSESIEGGQNYTFQVGYNIWSVADLKREWAEIRTAMGTDAALLSPPSRAGALFASLLAPDRQAWFLLD